MTTETLTDEERAINEMSRSEMDMVVWIDEKHFGLARFAASLGIAEFGPHTEESLIKMMKGERPSQDQINQALSKKKQVGNRKPSSEDEGNASSADVAGTATSTTNTTTSTKSKVPTRTDRSKLSFYQGERGNDVSLSIEIPRRRFPTPKLATMATKDEGEEGNNPVNPLADVCLGFYAIRPKPLPTMPQRVEVVNVLLDTDEEDAGDAVDAAGENDTTSADQRQQPKKPVRKIDDSTYIKTLMSWLNDNREEWFSLAVDRRRLRSIVILCAEVNKPLSRLVKIAIQCYIHSHFARENIPMAFAPKIDLESLDFCWTFHESNVRTGFEAMMPQEQQKRAKWEYTMYYHLIVDHDIRNAILTKVHIPGLAQMMLAVMASAKRGIVSLYTGLRKRAAASSADKNAKRNKKRKETAALTSEAKRRKDEEGKVVKNVGEKSKNEKNEKNGSGGKSSSSSKSNKAKPKEQKVQDEEQDDGEDAEDDVVEEVMETIEEEEGGDDGEEDDDDDEDHF